MRTAAPADILADAYFCPMTQTSQMLVYAPLASPDPPPRTARARRAVLVILIALPSLAAPFLPFDYGTSPFDVAIDVPFEPGLFSSWPLWLLGSGFLISVPLVLWKISRACARPPGRGEVRWAAWLAGLGCLAPVVGMLATLGWSVRDGLFDGDGSRGEALILAAAVGILAAGLFVVWRVSLRDPPGVATALLLTAYVTDVALAMAVFDDSLQIGWWVSGVAVLIAAAELVRMADLPAPWRNRFTRRSLSPPPLAPLATTAASSPAP